MPNYVLLEDAADRLAEARRISVVGLSGAGKSTLSQEIAARKGLRYVSLDRDMRWLPGWQVRDRAEQRALHDSFVAGEDWVIDGTSVSLMDTRLPRSDLLIWMRFPRRIALTGLARRVARGYGRTRPDMAPSCPERLPDGEFLRWIWRFERDQSPRVIAAIDRHAAELPVVALRNRAQVARLIERLPEKKNPRR